METNPSFPRVFIHPRYTYAYWEEFSSRGKEVSRLRRPPSLAIVARRRTTFIRKSILLIHKLKSFLPIMLYFYINTSIVVGRWRNRAETIIPFYSFPRLSVYPESTKALVASMLLLFQHSHYVSADSKSLLYLFFAL